MTYSSTEVQHTLNLFYFFQKNNYNSIQIRKYMKDIFNVSLSTVYTWLPKYITNIKNIQILYKTSKRISKITPEIEKFIINLVACNKLIRCKTIRKHLKNELNIDLSVKSVYNVLNKYNFTYKKIYKVINKLTEDEFKLKKQIMSDEVNKIKEENIISIDEMAIYINELPTYGWAKKGIKCEIISKGNLKQTKVSLLIAMNNKKIIKSVISKTNISGDIYLKFIRELNYKNKNKYFLMDNATIHHTKKLNAYVNKKKINIIYNIPYCPQFNPIENVNSMIRKEVQYAKNSTFDDIQTIINDFKNKNNKKIFQNIYRSTFKRLKS
jgi:transposase